MKSAHADFANHAGLHKPPRNKGQRTAPRINCRHCQERVLRSQTRDGVCRACLRAAPSAGRTPIAQRKGHSGPAYYRYLCAKVAECRRDGVPEAEIDLLIVYWRRDWNLAHGTLVGLTNEHRNTEDACSLSDSD